MKMKLTSLFLAGVAVMFIAGSAYSARAQNKAPKAKERAQTSSSAEQILELQQQHIMSLTKLLENAPPDAKPALLVALQSAQETHKRTSSLLQEQQVRFSSQSTRGQSYSPQPARIKGNNGVGNGLDPQPPGNPPVNDGFGASRGKPGQRRGIR